MKIYAALTEYNGIDRFFETEAEAKEYVAKYYAQDNCVPGYYQIKEVSVVAALNFVMNKAPIVWND